jgi:DNA invertase Pin-like site-specific DNA recombinase
MTAVAYVRRSASEESKVSRETQVETVHRLAAERGDTIGQIYVDWGRSGGSETRPEYLAMLARAEADGIHAIYAYDQDRLARSIWLFSGLMRLADLKGFRVITPAGDLTASDRRDFAEMRGVMDGAELRKITKRNRATAAKQRDRGDDLGMAPYGYVFRTPKNDGMERVVHELVEPEKIAHVLAMYRREGTYLGAARALNAEHWPSKHGRGWHATTVKEFIVREAPDLVTAVTQGRRREHRPRLFAGIMFCHCGGPMSPGTGGGQPGYYCGRGQRGNHARPYYVSESRLIPFMVAEAARFIPPEQAEQVEGEYDDSADRAALEALRGKVSDAVVNAGIADLNDRRAAHGEQTRRVVTVPRRIDWEGWDVAAIHAVLSAYWERVDLGSDLMPARFVWRPGFAEYLA